MTNKHFKSEYNQKEISTIKSTENGKFRKICRSENVKQQFKKRRKEK
jgi:hypothetical protein